MVAQFSHVPNNLQAFDIRNFADTLTPAKEKNKYICPVCEGHNLSIEQNTGEYQCFNGCECKDIREAIRPWSQVLEERKQGNHAPTHKPTPKAKPKPAPIPDTLDITTIPNPTPPEKTKQGENTITTYKYSGTTKVVRTDNPHKKKTTYPYYLGNDGWAMGKGEGIWPPYRLSEVIDFGKGKWILLVEGEKCVEVARLKFGIVTTTFQGGSWSETALMDGLQKIKLAGVAGVITWPDNDDTGYKKAEKCREIAAKIQLPLIELNPLELWQECPNKGDIADYWESQSMTGDELINILRKNIEAMRSSLQPSIESSIDPYADSKRGIAVDPTSQDLDQKLKLDLLALLQESDPIKKIRKRAEICSYFRLSKSEVEELLKHINRSANQEELKTYTIDDLFDLESEGLTWVIPEMLPRGETIILAGSPKAGKSLLAIDAAFAIATGESRFLGENVVTGKVLLVSCDESINSTKSKLIKRGFRRGDSIEILPKWTIDRLHKLEQKIEDYRPDVVIIDSLKRITHGSQISENSAEFADNIYTLKELFAKYNCSGILIHHSNKDKEATGVNKLRGSSAIAGAVWGTWQLDHILRPDPENKKKMIIDPKDPVRVLSVFARDTEGQTIKIEFNLENNSWERIGIEDDATELSYRERILSILRRNNQCEGLSGREIMELLGEDGNKSIYSELNRMVNKRLISCKPANNDKRINLYSLPVSQQTQNIGGDSPPPIPIVSTADYSAESLTTYSFENSQQNSQQLVSNSQQTTEKTNLPTNKNPYTVSTSLDSQQVLEIGGGEGVSPDCTEVANIADTVLSAEVSDPNQLPIVQTAEFQEPIKVGDIVESEKLPLGLGGWGKVVSICDDQVFVELAAKAIPMDSITSIRREK